MDSQDISFPGIDSIIGCEFTLSRGVSPSCCTLFIRPQSSLSLSRGELRFSFGSSEMSFPDMTPDVAHIRREPAKWALHLYDRRFYWKQGTITGEYNYRRPDGKLNNETNAQSLADKLLKALGETTHDVSRMSTTIFPYLNLKDTNPAYALANLLDYCSCTLCPGSNNKLIVYTLGDGGDLPDGNDDIAEYLPFKIQVPEKIIVQCGPDLYQSKLTLEASGVHAVSATVDGEIKPIANVNYAPSTGWGKDFYMFFPNVASASRSYAFDSIYRVFRPTGQAQGGMVPPGCEEVVIYASQYDLNDYQAIAISDPEDFIRPGRAFLDGTFWPQSDHAVNTGQNTVWGVDFSLIRGIVKTDYPVIKWSSANAIQAPDLYLNTSYTVWNRFFTDKARYTKSQNVGGAGTVILRRPELFRVFKSNYSYTSVTDTQTNKTAIESQVNEYLRLHAKKYDDPWILDREYGGIFPIMPDGKIAQVRWRIGFDGPTTRASKNFEFDTCNVGSDERRRRETVAQLQEGYR